MKKVNDANHKINAFDRVWLKNQLNRATVLVATDKICGDLGHVERVCKLGAIGAKIERRLTKRGCTNIQFGTINDRCAVTWN